MACLHSLAACQRHTPSSLAAVIGLSNNDVMSVRSLRCVRCVGWKPRLCLTISNQLYMVAHKKVEHTFFSQIFAQSWFWKRLPAASISAVKCGRVEHFFDQLYK